MWWLVGLVWAADPAPLVAKIEAKYGAVDTLQAGFTQTVKSGVYGTDVSHGQMTLQRPGRMRWDFTEDGRVYVTDGKLLWMYTPAQKQAVQYPYTPTGADTLLQSLDHVDELFTVTAPDAQPTDGGVIVDLTPKQPGQFTKVHLVLGADLGLRSLTITDPMGSVTELAFTDVKAGAAVPASTFTFTPPAGTQVISAAP